MITETRLVMYILKIISLTTELDSLTPPTRWLGAVRTFALWLFEVVKPWCEAAENKQQPDHSLDWGDNKGTFSYLSHFQCQIFPLERLASLLEKVDLTV